MIKIKETLIINTFQIIKQLNPQRCRNESGKNNQNNQNNDDDINIPFTSFEIKGLNPDLYYNISLRSYNNKGLSQDSNLVNFKAVVNSNLPKSNDNNSSIIVSKDNIAELKTDLEPEICPSN